MRKGRCAAATRPFNSPYGAFVNVAGEVAGRIAVNHREGLSYDDLIDAVAAEATTRAQSGRIAGAALMICATGPQGQDGLILSCPMASGSSPE